MPQAVENEHLHFGLGSHVLRPIVHLLEQILERGKQALAGLLQPFPINLADAFLEEQVEQGQLAVTQALFSRTSLLGIQAVRQLDQLCERFLDRYAILFAVV